MKLKKIFSAMLVSAVITVSSAVTAFAVEDGEATYCFDTDSRISDWTLYGSINETDVKLSHTIRESKNGDGCIIISENVIQSISDKFGGFYLEASEFGLENFSGCTIGMSVKLCEGAENYYDNFALYSDGIIWLSQSVCELSTEEWTDVSMLIPEGAQNPRVGFTIPTFSIYSGDVVYIDDFTITKPDGSVISNTGDYKLKTIAYEETTPTGKNILLTVLLIVLIFVIIGGVGMIVSAAIRRFA